MVRLSFNKCIIPFYIQTVRGCMTSLCRCKRKYPGRWNILVHSAFSMPSNLSVFDQYCHLHILYNTLVWKSCVKGTGKDKYDRNCWAKWWPKSQLLGYIETKYELEFGSTSMNFVKNTLSISQQHFRCTWWYFGFQLWILPGWIVMYLDSPLAIFTSISSIRPSLFKCLELSKTCKLQTNVLSKGYKYRKLRKACGKFYTYSEINLVL